MTTEEKSNLQNFLSQISQIVERHEEIQRLKGENFNIFSIMKMESDEVRTHSRFLADLLNPKGSHGQGDIFLEKFVEVLDKKDFSIPIENEKEKQDEDKEITWQIKDFETEKANIFVEKDTGKFGRIDILIQSDNKQIAIENKIYAGEGNEQLKRYGKYLGIVDKEKYQKQQDKELLFLTLWGDKSDNEENFQNYKSISYNKDILKWLKECRKEVVTLPLVREGISHYINLIKKLTDQTGADEMSEEIKKLMETEDNLEAITKLFKEQKNIIEFLINNYFIKPIEGLIEEEQFKEKLKIEKNDNFFNYSENDKRHKDDNNRGYGILIVSYKEKNKKRLIFYFSRTDFDSLHYYLSYEGEDINIKKKGTKIKNYYKWSLSHENNCLLKVIKDSGKEFKQEIKKIIQKELLN